VLDTECHLPDDNFEAIIALRTYDSLPETTVGSYPAYQIKLSVVNTSQSQICHSGFVDGCPKFSLAFMVTSNTKPHKQWVVALMVDKCDRICDC
jgi:hypothetical protein